MMYFFVQYAPPKIDGREWRDEDKFGFAKSVIDQITNYILILGSYFAL